MVAPFVGHARTWGRASRHLHLFLMLRKAAEKAAYWRSYAETARAHEAEPAARLPIDLSPTPHGLARSPTRWRDLIPARRRWRWRQENPGRFLLFPPLLLGLGFTRFNSIRFSFGFDSRSKSPLSNCLKLRLPWARSTTNLAPIPLLANMDQLV
jgi:hypothetical protein